MSEQQEMSKLSPEMVGDSLVLALLDSAPSISEEEKELASRALADFENHRYSSCLQKLKELANCRKADFKVEHNTAVCEFYRTDCSQTDQLKRHLSSLCSKFHLSLDNPESLEDVDHVIIFYNWSVVLYYACQYGEAVRILEKLFQFLEPIELSLMFKVLLLLTEVHLALHHTDKAANMVAYLEKVLADKFTSSTSATHKNKAGGEKNSSESPRELPFGDDVESHLESSEKYRAKLHRYKTRIYLQAKSIKSCKREVKLLTSTIGMTTTSIFLKSNFEYQRQNYRKAVKLLASAHPLPPASKTGHCHSALYFNSLGCIHFHLHKHQLATHYFSRALAANTATLQQLPRHAQTGQLLSERPLHMLGVNKRPQLLYNYGVQLLHAGHPLRAFDCLLQVVHLYRDNPRLWLRLAEACIAINTEEEAKVTTASGQQWEGSKGAGAGWPLDHQKGISHWAVGSARHRKLVLAPANSHGNKYICSNQSAAMPEATLEFAALCLRNALFLIPNGQTLPDSGGLAAAPGAPLKAVEVASLKCSVLAASAFVCLGLGDYVTALTHAKNLLNQPQLSPSLRYLGHMYTAEAMAAMDNIYEALQHLTPDTVSDLSTLHPGALDSADKDRGPEGGDGSEADAQAAAALVYPSSVGLARSMMLCNQAALHCLRSDYDKARKSLHAACQQLTPASPASQQALVTAAYLELKNGNIGMALQMIKKNQVQHPPTPATPTTALPNNRGGLTTAGGNNANSGGGGGSSSHGRKSRK